MSVSHYDREAEDCLPPSYSTRPNSTDNNNDRVRDAEEGRNERRSLDFVESLFVGGPAPVHAPQRAHVVTTTEVRIPQPSPNRAPAHPRVWMRLTRKGNRSKSMDWYLHVLMVIAMLIVALRGIGVLGCRRLLYLFHLRGGVRQVAFKPAGED